MRSYRRITIPLHPSQTDLPFSFWLDLVAARVAAIVEKHFVLDRQRITDPCHGMVPASRLGVAIEKRLAEAVPSAAIAADRERGVADSVWRTVRIAWKIIVQDAD